MKNYIDKFQGCLLGVAIGDTLGKPFEGKLREGIHSQFSAFGKFVQENKKLFDTYTDDTQLTLHTAQALIDGNGFKLDSLIAEYVEWLDDPPIGPGYGCISAIRKLRYGVPWKEAASNSGGNGSAMRVSPIGLFYMNNMKALKEAAIGSSVITHSHPAASCAAVVVARAIAYLVKQTPKLGFSVDEFFRELLESIQDSQEEVWQEFIVILQKVKDNLNVPLISGLIKFSQIGVYEPYFIQEYLGKAFVHPYALSTVACSLFVFLKTLNSFEDCIYALSTAGGDCDTIGAIGGSLAGAYFGKDNTPDRLIKLVKNHKKILKIASKLHDTFQNRNKRF